MNKSKYILPLLVAPILFGCNKGVTGNYVVDENITYIFTEGTEANYNKEEHSSEETFYPTIAVMKSKIYNVLTSYSDGTPISDKAIHLTDDCPLQRQTKTGETIETRAANVKEESESSLIIGFEWGKEKSGYHFYDNYTGYVDHLRVYEHIGNSNGGAQHIWIGENGFDITGNTLTAHFVTEIDNGNGVLEYKIDFTVTARK